MSRNQRLIRIRFIRRRVAATALAIFVLSFATIAATGSMGTSHKAATTQHRQTARTAAANDGEQESGEDDSTTTTSNSRSQSYTPVTTQQS